MFWKVCNTMRGRQLALGMIWWLISMMAFVAAVLVVAGQMASDDIHDGERISMKLKNGRQFETEMMIKIANLRDYSLSSSSLVGEEEEEAEAEEAQEKVASISSDGDNRIDEQRQTQNHQRRRQQRFLDGSSNPDNRSDDGINSSNQSKFDSLAYALSSASSFYEDDEPGSSSSDNMETFGRDNRRLKLLHRNRRYLLFPEGSSFQLVFDLIIPIVDYTNYAIMGITCAVAWELPSKAPSDIIKSFRDKLTNNSFGLLRRKDYFENKFTEAKESHRRKIPLVPTQKEVTKTTTTLSTSNWNGLSHFDIKKSPIRTYEKSKRRDSGMDVKKFNSYSNKIESTNAIFGKNRKEVNWWNKPIGFPISPSLFEKPRHAVYPVMGKRSIRSSSSSSAENLDSELDAIHLRLHRSTRHRLYSKIQKMYQVHNYNGTECVLQALCEIGQKRHQTKPESLLKELIRTIFTIPPKCYDGVNDCREKNQLHSIYDRAQGHIGDCSKQYPFCSHNVWNMEWFF